jgi:cytochrome bd ubiquinol oxidase subunit II
METLWFCLVAVMIAMYVVFDGFDLGAGIVQAWVARTSEERRTVIRTIGPVWDGNEVWLIAGGGTLFFAFPTLYAASFSGFYLPLMMVLWLLILRGCSIEFRDHIRNDAWRPFWDTVFRLSSSVLAIVFGAALGNVVRGVAFDENGRFFAPLWVVGAVDRAGILDPYTVTVGITAYAALAMHGALWLAHKTVGPIADRARRVARGAWIGTAALTVVITLWTMRLQPLVPGNLASRPWGVVFPTLAVVGLVFVWLLNARGATGRAFLASCAFLIGMLTSAAFGIYPYVLPSILDPARGLTVSNAAAPESGLRIGLIWWSIGMALATCYVIFVYQHFSGRVTGAGSEEGGYGGA